MRLSIRALLLSCLLALLLPSLALALGARGVGGFPAQPAPSEGSGVALAPVPEAVAVPVVAPAAVAIPASVAVIVPPGAGVAPVVASPSPSGSVAVTVSPSVIPVNGAAEVAVAESPAVPPTTEELLATGSAALKQVVAAVEAEKDSKGIQWVAWAGALAMVFTLLLGLLRKWGGLLLNEQHLRVATLLLGLLAGLCASLALGAPDWAALVMAASGPGSMLVYAIVDLFRPGSWAKAQERADEKKDSASPLVP
jgi:hypothetical protein